MMTQPTDPQATHESTGPAWYQTPQFWLALCLALLGLAGLLLTGRGRARPATVAVTAARDLPAYTLLRAGDVVTATVPVTDSASIITDTAAAVGRFTTGPLAKGAPLSPATLLDAPAVGPDWWIITVPVSPTVAPLPGETVLLVGVDAAGRSQPVSEQAVVLGPAGQAQALALPPAEGALAVTYLAGGRRLLVVRQP
jgi:hypothetical protein